MKNTVIGAVIGALMTALLCGAYARAYMVDMRTVVEIESTAEGVQIVTSSGEGYWWER